MTPEHRAAQMLNEATELGLLDRSDKGTLARWHSIIASTITAALCEARDRCQSVPDRLAIGELMVHEWETLPAPQSTPESEVGPGVIECMVCHGKRGSEGVSCPACNGMGVIADSGVMPDHAPGEVAYKKECGCFTDWFGDGAPEEYKTQRRRIWAERGWASKRTEWHEGKVNEMLTKGAGCHHDDRRAEPRQGTPVMDLSELPPGGEV